MEIFMRNVSFAANRFDIITNIAGILHGPDFESYATLPLNFHVRLNADRRRSRSHGGTGNLTLTTIELGTHFLRDYGGPTPRKSLDVRGRIIKFEVSRKSARPDIVGDIRRLPYLDPRAVQEQEARVARLQAASVSLKQLQFGWECRDNVFSPEHEYSFDAFTSCHLSFDGERKDIRIKITNTLGTKVIAIRFSEIQWFSAGTSVSQLPIIFFSLLTPPSFESESSPKRQRLVCLDSGHARIAPFTSIAIRLVCTSAVDLNQFRRFSRIAQLQNAKDIDYPVEYRELFSSRVLDSLESWLLELDWEVAFQVEALVRSLAVDAKEMLSLRGPLNHVVNSKGAAYATSLLRHFANNAKTLYWDPAEPEESQQSIEQCFRISEAEYALQARSSTSTPSDNVVDCLHVTISPTSMRLEGPFPERSNRVLRSYADHHDSFLRVSFSDENRMQLRFDREVDGPAFAKLRVGSALREGIKVAGRSFEFLAYSQSALKEHAVWFVKEFFDLGRGCIVNASTIIKSLGSFSSLSFDPKLIYCPARYGARISQAFTSTDGLTSVVVDEVLLADDIENDSWCFTDGVGSISQELAHDMWKELRATRRRKRRIKAHPRAFQVRFQGSKGMLSVDYRLSGNVICLRPSMVKFQDPNSRQIEIAQAFDRPGKYYLNRPLIMILEHLGVPYEVFQDLQDLVVSDAHASLADIERAARLLEAHGLGNSFRMTSVMLSLAKLGVSMPADDFYEQMMQFAIHHVLRELKQRARIPVPGAYTLVGVADIHAFLKPKQIFACIRNIDSSVNIYLKGPVLISRSPTIHPGDVQIVHAIGEPPPNSCFAHEPLPNTVVFSTKGDRPVPSCLGGGDLDGDVYNLIPLDDLPLFTPKKTYRAGQYDPAPKKYLDRPSTMNDVADFFVDYINSDVLGIIATNWLIIADQSDLGIVDPDCLTLAQLHSDAVDYPKSGQPVSLDKIPKLKFKAKPDWDAPETAKRDSTTHYESRRALGRLSRAIDLPALSIVRTAERRQGRQLRMQSEETLEDLLENLHLNNSIDDPVYIAVETRVAEFIPIDPNYDLIQDIAYLYHRHTSELHTICMAHTISPQRSAILTEEEAMIGTIVAKCSQPRLRRDLMGKMRELTERLVREIREDIAGEDDAALESPLERAWAAWQLSVAQGESFGARSFGWIALGVIFEAVKDIEEALR